MGLVSPDLHHLICSFSSDISPSEKRTNETVGGTYICMYVFKLFCPTAMTRGEGESGEVGAGEGGGGGGGGGGGTGGACSLADRAWKRMRKSGISLSHTSRSKLIKNSVVTLRLSDANIARRVVLG